MNKNQVNTTFPKSNKKIEETKEKMDTSNTYT
jgi:hypothetical protein